MNLHFASISFLFSQLVIHPSLSFSLSLILTLSFPLSPILFPSPQHFQIYWSHTAYPWRNQPWRSKKIKIFPWITTGSFYKGVVKIILRACPCWDIYRVFIVYKRYCIDARLYRSYFFTIGKNDWIIWFASFLLPHFSLLFSFSSFYEFIKIVYSCDNENHPFISFPIMISTFADFWNCSSIAYRLYSLILFTFPFPHSSCAHASYTYAYVYLCSRFNLCFYVCLYLCSRFYLRFYICLYLWIPNCHLYALYSCICLCSLIQSYGLNPDGTESSTLKAAIGEYVQSLAGYSMVCYILAIKDRWDGGLQCSTNYSTALLSSVEFSSVQYSTV